MIDSHAHLYFERFDEDREAVIDRAREAGVEAIVNIGIDARSSEASVALARRHADFHAAVGLHPTSQVDDRDAEIAAISRLAAAERESVVAIGEIGLDYYWKDVPAEEQKLRLERQLDLALESGLPVIFHCRDALPDLLASLKRRSALPPGVFHCFAGGAAEAEEALQLGFHVSFAGNVTYPKATELQEAARAVPADRLLLETDSPFLPPQPRRGKRNEPAFLRHSCEFLATIKGMDPDDLARLTARTTRRLFGI